MSHDRHFFLFPSLFVCLSRLSHVRGDRHFETEQKIVWGIKKKFKKKKFTTESRQRRQTFWKRLRDIGNKTKRHRDREREGWVKRERGKEREKRERRGRDWEWECVLCVRERQREREKGRVRVWERTRGKNARERESVRESERGTLDLKRPLNAKRKTPTC